MFFTTTALVPLLAALATALPTNNPVTLKPRAGAPAYVAIEPPCYLSYPIPSNASSAVRPVDTSSQIYHWDIALGDAKYSNETTWWTNCIEQCNGLSGCKAAFLAYNVPSEPIYSSPGGNPSVACRMFNVVLDASSFEPVTNGSYVQAMAANIDGCGK